MSVIEPGSPREIGVCGCGCNRPVVLGDVDCDGYYVGWITEDGVPFEDRAERDRAVGGGRLLDAWIRFNDHGGVLGQPPNYEAILDEHDVLPSNRGDALRELETSIEIYGCDDAVLARATRALDN